MRGMNVLVAVIVVGLYFAFTALVVLAGGGATTLDQFWLAVFGALLAASLAAYFVLRRMLRWRWFRAFAITITLLSAAAVLLLPAFAPVRAALVGELVYELRLTIVVALGVIPLFLLAAWVVRRVRSGPGAADDAAQAKRGEDLRPLNPPPEQDA